MNKSIYAGLLALLGLGFAVFFFVTMGPPFFANPDLPGAALAGFVNPYSTGYAVDTIACWVLLLVWVVYERKKVKHGWVAILLGIVPGVATGIALYLFLRMKQLNE